MKIIITVFDIQTSDNSGKQSGDGDRIHELPLAVIRLQGQRAFAQMCQSLSEAHHKERVGILGVVLS